MRSTISTPCLGRATEFHAAEREILRYIAHEGSVRPKEIGMVFRVLDTRLADTRVTTKIAYAKRTKESAEKIEALRSESREWGEWSFRWFNWKYFTLGLGAIFLLIALWLIFQTRLFPSPKDWLKLFHPGMSPGDDKPISRTFSSCLGVTTPTLRLPTSVFTVTPKRRNWTGSFVSISLSVWGAGWFRSDQIPTPPGFAVQPGSLPYGR